MGLTKNLGWLSKYITADSSGNIGVGAQSPTSKLQVTGGGSPNNTIFATTSNYASSSAGSVLRIGHVSATGNTTAIIQNLTAGGTAVGNISFPEGNVGIGTSTPASIVPGTNLTINGSSVGYGSLFLQSNNVDRAFFSADATNLLIGTAGASTNMLFYLGGSERVRMTVGGNVLIGTTTDNGAKLQVNGTVTASGRLSLGDGIVSNFNAISISSGVYTNTAAISIGASNPTGGVVSPIITFTAPNASYSYAVRGGMYYNGSNLQMEFRTTSDYRVKEDLIEDFNAIDLLDKIKIYDHKWIGASGRSYSVIAHELQDVIPYLVSGQKDAILEDGSMDLQSVDYSKLVPILIKGIQELTERIKTLENK